MEMKKKSRRRVSNRIIVDNVKTFFLLSQLSNNVYPWIVFIVLSSSPKIYDTIGIYIYIYMHVCVCIITLCIQEYAYIGCSNLTNTIDEIPCHRKRTVNLTQTDKVSATYFSFCIQNKHVPIPSLKVNRKSMPRLILFNEIHHLQYNFFVSNANNIHKRRMQSFVVQTYYNTN